MHASTDFTAFVFLLSANLTAQEGVSCPKFNVPERREHIYIILAHAAHVAMSRHDIWRIIGHARAAGSASATRLLVAAALSVRRPRAYAPSDGVMATDAKGGAIGGWRALHIHVNAGPRGATWPAGSYLKLDAVKLETVRTVARRRGSWAKDVLVGLLGKSVFGSIALVRPRWKPSACTRFRSRRKTLRCRSTNETLMPLMPYKFCCAGKIHHRCAHLRRRRRQRRCFGNEGPREAGAESVWGQRRRR
jgi:hypothetical protein